MRARSSLIVPACLCACLSACGRDEGAIARARDEVIGGATDDAHAAVVSIVTAVDAASPELCSGVLVAPRVVLTAGHCTLGQAPADLVVGFGARAASPTAPSDVARVLTYPSFGALDDFAYGVDLGAVVLDADAPIAPMRVRRTSFGGGTATVVGFGMSVATDLDTRGVRRSAPVDVTVACSALFAFGDATRNACHGDSGGPLLVPAADGVEEVVGVTSFGDEAACATSSYAVRAVRALPWIDAVVAGTIAAGDDAGSASFPGRADDCVADAGVDATDATDADAAVVDASSPSAREPVFRVGGGGCSIRGRGDEGSLVAALGAIAALALVRRARRRR